jgi:hypothetical protein
MNSDLHPSRSRAETLALALFCVSALLAVAFAIIATGAGA